MDTKMKLSSNPNSQHLAYCWHKILWHVSSITYESVLLVWTRVYICACLEVWAGCRQWPLGNQGTLCHASLNVWHCVSWDGAWLVYEASKNDGWVMSSRGYSMYVCASCLLCVCACVLAGVRDTGQHCDMSGWHPVKASWQVVMLPSGSHTPL